MLDRVEYRIARADREREDVFRLRHDGYVRGGNIDPIPSGIFSDKWDHSPNALLLGAYLDGALAATVRR